MVVVDIRLPPVAPAEVPPGRAASYETGWISPPVPAVPPSPEADAMEAPASDAVFVFFFCPRSVAVTPGNTCFDASPTTIGPL
jgi:hypothetical protein